MVLVELAVKWAATLADGGASGQRLLSLRVPLPWFAIPCVFSPYVDRRSTHLRDATFLCCSVILTLAFLTICFPFLPIPALSLFSWDSFSSTLYHAAFSRLILSRFLTLQLSNSPERPADCFSAWDQIITLQSLCQLFSFLFLLFFVFSPSAGCIDAKKCFVFAVGHCSVKPRFSASGRLRDKTLLQCQNDSIDYCEKSLFVFMVYYMVIISGRIPS